MRYVRLFCIICGLKPTFIELYVTFETMSHIGYSIHSTCRLGITPDRCLLTTSHTLQIFRTNVRRALFNAYVLDSVQHNGRDPSTSYTDTCTRYSHAHAADLWSIHMACTRVTSLAFSPCERLLAVGFWNDACAVFENVWQPYSIFESKT